MTPHYRAYLVYSAPFLPSFPGCTELVAPSAGSAGEARCSCLRGWFLLNSPGAPRPSEMANWIDHLKTCRALRTPDQGRRSSFPRPRARPCVACLETNLRSRVE